MTTLNEDTIARFLAAVKGHSLPDVLKEFNDDSVLGISEHGDDIGPAFRGKQRISKLFDKLFHAFPDVELKRVQGVEPLFSQTGASRIGIQADLAGHYQHEWFKSTDLDFSRPLSNIAVNNNSLADRDNPGGIPGIPTFALFTFDSGHKIARLALYLDRFKFIKRLGEEQQSALAALAVQGGATRSRVTIQIE